MSQVETLPQSIVDKKTIVLKPRLEQDDIALIGEKIKTRLFSKLGFRPKSEEIRLLCLESYFEPYLIIGGKYALDYCKKNVFRVKVNERTDRVFVAGQEFRPEQADLGTTSKIIKMIGEEHTHHQREAYFILDRMKREIAPEKLPIFSFDIQKENVKPKSDFKSIDISDEIQIEFLKTKIAKRPADVAEIIRENFDITERTIAYYPMYHLIFENAKNKKIATITINGITGEIILNGTKIIAAKTILAFPKTVNTEPIETINPASQTKDGLEIPLLDTAEEITSLSQGEIIQQPVHQKKETVTLGFPAEVSGEVFVVGDNITAVVGDITIPSNTEINKILVVKGSLRIGDNCRTHGKVKALKDVIIGADTVIEGDLIAGGKVLVGPRSHITGSLEAAGFVKIGANTTIDRGLHSGSAPDVLADIQLEVVEIEDLQ